MNAIAFFANSIVKTVAVATFIVSSPLARFTVNRKPRNPFLKIEKLAAEEVGEKSLSLFRMFSYRRIVATFIFLFTLSPARAQLPADKDETTPVGPGVWHREIYRQAGPWAIHVIEFDRRNSYLQLKTTKANDRLFGNERTSSMAARQDRKNHRVVAAINGDFYDQSGVSINLQLLNGEILREPSPHSVLAISEAGCPLIDILSLVGGLQAADGNWQPLHGVNRARNADEMIFFNYYFGSSTGTNNWGSEIRIQPLTRFGVNDTFRAVVRELRYQTGNTALDDSTHIISGHGKADSWIKQRIALGDTIKLVWRIPETRWRLTEAIGGLPRLVRNGEISIESDREGGSSSFTNSRHPRTAVGFNADTSRIFFVTVDGRQPGYSDGMTLQELAELMRELGCTQALNLDGGGATTMVIRGKVVNRPSDVMGERAVANALLLISTAPTGPLAHLRIRARTANILSGESFDFDIAATDSFYNPLDFTDKDVFWKVPKPLGSIDRHGVFTAGVREDSGYVVACRDLECDSVRVVVTVIKNLRLVPDPVILQIGQSQPMQIKLIDSRGRELMKSLREVRWEVQGGVGTISNEGVFAAGNPGRGWIVAHLRSGDKDLTGRVGVRIGQ
jgi:hypothetical protein